MRKSLIAAALVGAFSVPTFAVAADAAPAATPAPASPHTFTGNLTVANDYRFRGLSQTFRQPTVQGGIDYSHASGIYLGTWMSNVSGLSYPNGAGLEMDLYGGYKASIGDVGLDVGYLKYYYPGAECSVATCPAKPGFDNQEVYIAASYKWVTLKYSHAISDYFGLNNTQVPFWGGKPGVVGANATLAPNGDSKGSNYIDLTANVPLTEKLTLVAHYGHTKVKNYGKLDYSDYKLALNYDLNGWVLGLAYVSTNAEKDYYYVANANGNVKNTGTGTAVVSVSKSF